MKDVTSDESNVKTRMVVSAPRTSTHAAATHTPDLGRSLGLSVGWETAMNSVFCCYALAVEATLGGVGLVDVEDVEAVAKEKTAKA